ncbi:SusD/RagB family nutrient-binding outer membrane lipoprotein [Mariniphaga sediminis]|uniref:SusD/RagB family nutrient-binding outer membrane lipoprotein n=1 Tax=Mariniphaga sediminis TaxID=1628158 RepID=A0A399D166_9BACT|nr:SusD/RagB family nutrient-binding outer membrane lipoprotein [Mariniphaga sediminis]RIH64110.1 SusD/RagB family nutrient-binding outer membrane lipoprotein [Mariniphaga sediminis]
MNKIKNSFVVALTIILASFFSCKDLDELNINPNGADPAIADLNLLMPTFVVGIGQQVVGLGVGDIAGVMQHTQKDGWSGGHNDYDWGIGSKSWSGYYGILRNIDEFHKKAIEGEYEFHQGVALVMKAYTFGLIADLWGDAPYTEALKAEEGEGYFKPVFDPQKDIYLGILADLENANTLLSKGEEAYMNIVPTQDLIYSGSASKWRKLANSLALRYYMRLSEKESGIAQEGISKIASDPGTYPVITSASDDATIDYIGSSPSDSWPTNTVYDTDPRGAYFRVKMCATLVEAMQELNDPRLGVYANKIEIPLQKVEGEEIDRIVNGIREVSQDIIDDYTEAWGVGVDFDTEYVGIPPSIYAAPQYNLNPNLDQAVYNPHCSQLNDMYKETNGDLLLMRLMSAAEVHFILSEAALYGWISGSPDEHYASGIQESFNAWGLGDAFDGYIAGAPYSGLESIIEQKWIASWTAAAESWFDWRRTGLPELQTGESARREALPLRFYYHYADEIAKNTVNAEEAISRLEPTQYKGNDPSNNSAWSKMWLLQGTGKPY